MYLLWLHVIRSQGFSCLKWWLWWGIKSVSWFGFKRMTWQASRYVFIRLQPAENGYQSFSRACAAAAAAAMNESLFPIIRFESDRKSVITATLPNNQRPDRSPHIIFNSNETLTETNMHIQNETLHGFTVEKNIVRATEWSTEIKRNVWMYATCLSNCCLGTNVLSIDHQHHSDILSSLILFFWTLILHFIETRGMFAPPHTNTTMA